MLPSKLSLPQLSFALTIKLSFSLNAFSTRPCDCWTCSGLFVIRSSNWVPPSLETIFFIYLFFWVFDKNKKLKSKTIIKGKYWTKIVNKQKIELTATTIEKLDKDRWIRKIWGWWVWLRQRFDLDRCELIGKLNWSGGGSLGFISVEWSGVWKRVWIGKRKLTIGSNLVGAKVGESQWFAAKWVATSVVIWWFWRLWWQKGGLRYGRRLLLIWVVTEIDEKNDDWQ